MADYQEVANKLFEAMDIITSKRISNLSYDKTLICTIENVENAKNGAYKVTDGVSHFIAYTDNSNKYPKGTKVYVKVPNGDMSNQKIITGLYLNDDNEYITYISPLDSFIDITNNMISNEFNLSLKANDFNRPSIVVWEYTPERTFSEKARDKRRKYVQTDDTLSLQDKTRRLQIINTTDSYEETLRKIEEANVSADDKIVLKNELNLITVISGIRGYNRIGLAGNFMTALDSRVIKGSYGIRLDITARTESGATDVFCYFLDSEDDMYGNPYRYSTYYRQEQVYDISNIFEIINLRLVFYQKSDFVLEDGTDLVVDEIENIFLTAPYIALGYGLETFKEDTILLGTNDSLTYSTEIKPPERSVYMRWIHLVNGRFYSIDEMEETPAQADIHWYRYKVEQDRYDNLAGMFWKEFDPGEYKYGYTFEPDYNTDEDAFKVIIEMPSKSAITNELHKNEELNILIEEIGSANILRDMLELTDLEELNAKYLEVKTNYVAEENLEKFNEFYNIILEARAKTQYFYSDPVVFTNEISQSDEAIDLIQSLSIQVDDENYRGIYRLYDQTNSIINKTEANRMRTLRAKYNSVITGVNVLNSADDITWYMPINNSMIHEPVRGKEYTSEDEYIENCGREGYVAIRRRGVDTTEDLGEGVSLINTEQLFRIKDYYTQAASNNTIYCEITKRGKKYKSNITLLFGTTGTEGAEANFILKMYSEGNEVQAITLNESVDVIPELFDFNNKPIDLTNVDITYSWKSYGGDGLEGKQEGHKYHITAGDNIANCHYYILQASVDSSVVYENEKANNKSIIAYLPIAVRSSDNYAVIEGPTKIIYDKSGNNPSYYKKPYKLYNDKLQPYSGIIWQVSFMDDNECQKYYPKIINGNELQPSNMYIEGLEACCVYATFDNKMIWTQPLLISKGQYTSGVLSDWDGSLTINEKNGTILATMIGAGIKNSDNTFSGVLMGNVTSSNAGVHSGIGLYGFHQNNQSFGFNVNGTAFIGKAGSGQIIFDGNNGIIKSYNYSSGNSGMMIDLDDAILRAYGSSGKFELDMDGGSNLLRISNSSYKTLFNIGTGNYYLQTADYNGVNAGMKIDLENSTLNAYDTSGRFEMNMGRANNLLKISNGSGKVLFNVGSSSYYLQTADYTANSKGMKIDLEKSTLNAYDSYGKFEMNMASSNLLKISTGGDSSKVLFNIGSNNYYLQSANYSEGTKGIRLDLANGNFEFMGKTSGKGSMSISCLNEGILFAFQCDKGNVYINTFGPTIRSLFTITNGEGLVLFSIGEDICQIEGQAHIDNSNNGGFFNLETGELFCQKFEIKGWTMDENGLKGISKDGTDYFSVSSTGEVYIKGKTTIENDIEIEGKAIINKNLEVKEETLLGKLTVLDDCEIKGLLACNELNITGNLKCSNLECSGLTVSGKAYREVNKTINTSTLGTKTIRYVCGATGSGSGSDFIMDEYWTYELSKDANGEYTLTPTYHSERKDIYISVNVDFDYEDVNIATKGEDSSVTLNYLGYE